MSTPHAPQAPPLSGENRYGQPTSVQPATGPSGRQVVARDPACETEERGAVHLTRRDDAQVAIAQPPHHRHTVLGEHAIGRAAAPRDSTAGPAWRRDTGDDRIACPPLAGISVEGVSSPFGGESGRVPGASPDVIAG